ncbi:hypothetical protein J437_LFUL007822 [Ladona fulva]|uniref:Uncharacterized protein n=1 Tax=Ladona fulva TaxID=123851 RepID=A0A8K0NZ82_LADFU|nr:hypothetical protein J437_LFUL007822 [Ladona fulva]
MYRTVNTITKGEPRKIRKQGILNEDGKMTLCMEENKRVWTKYIDELYDSLADHTKLVPEEESECDEDDKGPKILRFEVERRILDLREKKALCCDKVPSEALRALGYNAITRLISLVRRIYKLGIWPEKILKSVLVPLPKKSNAKECKDYRTITFIFHFTNNKTIITENRKKN